MTGVIIAADCRDKKMWHTLPEILRRNLSADFVEGAPGEGQEIAICDAARVRELNLTRAVVICKDGWDLANGIPAGGEFIAVVDSASPKALEGIRESGVPAITCGLSSRDTLTLASYEEDSAVLGVQRSISCFDGALAEPQEIPLRLSGPIDSFTLMAAAAVFLLTGHAMRLREIVF